MAKVIFLTKKSFYTTKNYFYSSNKKIRYYLGVLLITFAVTYFFHTNIFFIVNSTYYLHADIPNAYFTVLYYVFALTQILFVIMLYEVVKYYYVKILSKIWSK